MSLLRTIAGKYIEVTLMNSGSVSRPGHRFL